VWVEVMSERIGRVGVGRTLDREPFASAAPHRAGERVEHVRGLSGGWRGRVFRPLGDLGSVVGDQVERRLAAGA
jgi:hypothetical protein